MANYTRCPECNQFGSKRLEGYCKDHYPNRHYPNPDTFKRCLFEFHQQSPKIVVSALAEVGADNADAVKPEHRTVVLNFCRRRLPRTRKRHIESEESFIGESEFWGYRRHGEFDTDGYKMEKGDYGIER